jgi:hypothetical protein
VLITDEPSMIKHACIPTSQRLEKCKFLASLTSTGHPCLKMNKTKTTKKIRGIRIQNERRKKYRLLQPIQIL